MERSEKGEQLSLTVTLTLAAHMRAFLDEQIACQNYENYEDALLTALNKLIASNKRRAERRAAVEKNKVCHNKPAPLDAFLPQGANPFDTQLTEPAKELDFQAIQLRMDTGKIPSILR